MSLVLVTGCDGFVGRLLVERMVAAGDEVWGVDRVQTTGPAGFAGVRRIVADLTDRDAVFAALEAAKPERIVHLAGQASVRLSFDEPIPTILNNTVPALYLLEWLKRTSGVRLLAIGSAEEYGTVSPDRLPLSETTPVDPVSPYALAKSIQNQCCGTFTSLYHVDAVITRSFNHTGAGQSDVFVLPGFARQIAEIKAGRRERVLRVGNLDVKRDFTDVRDVCDAYTLLLEKGESGETYNVCSGTSYSIRDLLDRMCELAGVDVDIVVDPERLRPADMPELRGDASKLTAATGWVPAISIDDTLRSLLDHWDERVSTEAKSKSNS